MGVVWLLPQAWTMACRVSGAPPVTGKAPTTAMDSDEALSYPVFIPKLSTHRMHDPISIVPHIRLKMFTDNQMSRIKYNYYINSVSKDRDDSQ
jgi:hypothetical protein